MPNVWVERADLRDVVDEFPSEYDRGRIATYAENRLIRHDHHEDVFPKIQALLDNSADTAARERWAGLQYVPANVCGMLAKANAEDLFLEPPALGFGDDDAAKDIGRAWAEVADRSAWNSLILDEIDGGSVNGDAALKVYVKDGKAVVDGVDVSLVFRGEDYFPEYAAAQPDRRTTRFPFIATPIEHDGQQFVLLELHEPGRVLYRAFRWSTDAGKEVSFANEGVLGASVEPSAIGCDVEDYDTGLPDPALHIIRNDRGEHAFWGASAYTRGVKALQDSINWQLSTLLSHGERLCAGGVLVLPEEMRASVVCMDSGGAGGKDYSRRSLTGGSVPALTRRTLDVVFEHAQNQGSTRYVAETPQYEGAMKLLEGLWSTFERVTNLTLDPLFEQATAPESGRAMRMSRYRDQRRDARVKVRWTEPLGAVVVAALALDGIVAPRPSFAWCDTIKLSDQEKAEVMASRTGNKATLSVETAIARYDGMSEDEAQAEAEKIEQDGASATRSNPALFSETRKLFPDETTEAPGEGGAS